MSDERDPATDQSLPEDGNQDVQSFIIDMLQTQRIDIPAYRAMARAVNRRRAYGINKYGKPLQTQNGRDWLLDAWEEAMDLYCYAVQGMLETAEGVPGHVNVVHLDVIQNAEILFRSLTSLRLDRGDVL